MHYIKENANMLAEHCNFAFDSYKHPFTSNMQSEHQIKILHAFSHWNQKFVVMHMKL